MLSDQTWGVQWVSVVWMGLVDWYAPGLAEAETLQQQLEDVVMGSDRHLIHYFHPSAHSFILPAIPDPVTFVQNSSQTTATSVSFSWLPPAHDGNKEIRRYWIRYYQADSTAGESISGQSVGSSTCLLVSLSVRLTAYVYRLMIFELAVAILQL